MPRRARIVNRRRGGMWWRLPLALVIWLGFAAPVVAALVIWSILRGYAADLPAEPDLDRWAASLPATTILRAADGTILAEIPFDDHGAMGHRLPVRYAEIPPRMVDALLAAEDVRFFEHDGVDLHAIVRAARANFRAGHVVEGASTITQQVARNLLPEAIGAEQNLRRKVREALVARALERRYSKQRILEVYANQVFLGAGAYGIAAAARAYFDARLGDLDLAETALIAGLAQAPGRADPYKDLAAARRRRDEVLDRMVRAGFVDAASGARAQAEPIVLRRPPRRYGTIAPWYTEWARREVASGAAAEWARGGLTVDTAAQPVLAAVAERAAIAETDRLGHGGAVPEVAAVVWDLATGYVDATVGGRNFGRSRFDRATQACRQPGSAFKPVVYAAALDSGAITEGTALRDAPVAEYDAEHDVHWKPSNHGREFRGVALAIDALALSLNAPAVDVMDRVGVTRVIELAGRLGLTTELAAVRPLVLGASCVIPLELAGAFATFARAGARRDPIFVVRVRRGDRVLVDRASPDDPTLTADRRLDRVAAELGSEATPALDPTTAWLVSDMLREVVRRGTATAARGLDRDAAGKTGTTNENGDAWFVGYTARTLAAVWVGHDDARTSLGARDDGAHAALPLWLALIRAAEGERPALPWPAPPADLERARIDPESGLLAAPGAGGGEDLWFRRGTAPVEHAGDASGVPGDLGRSSREF